jgi:PKD domain
VAALLALVVVGLLAGPAAAQPSPAPPQVIDGPSAAIQTLGGLSVARDGTGGLVYLKTVAGIARVFVSRLVGGQFQPPEQVDATLAGASSQPVIAAGNGGVLLIGFINGGVLYAVDRPSVSGPYTAPIPLAAGASNPSLQMTNFGKGYMAFTVAAGAGFDVRAGYYYDGAWALESAPLNAVPGDDAGTGAGRPDVAAAGDGVAIVVWGEDGHVYSRRVWATAPSIVDEQADVPSLSGCGEVSAGDPSVSAGGDSSYADVAFEETVSCAGVEQTRVLLNRLRGSEYDGITSADGLSTPGAASADDPQVAMTEYGAGWVTAAQENSNAVVGMELGDNGTYGDLQQIDSLPGASAPYAAPGVAGVFSDLIAWQQNPGTTGPAEIRLRYEPKAASLGPETVVSSPASGPTDAARGLADAGDVGGDAAVAWVQGAGASTQIVVAQLYQPPGSVVPAQSLAYVRTAQPVLSWAPPPGYWGPMRYTVSVQGVPAQQTNATSLRVPTPLRDGPHAWEVTAFNPAGVSGKSSRATVFVDTVAPTLSVRLSGARRAGSALTVTLRYRDAPPPGLPARDASGVATLTIRWGDGTTTHLNPGTHRGAHAYRRPGRYRITVVVADRAGNSRTVVKTVKIAEAGPGAA